MTSSDRVITRTLRALTHLNVGATLALLAWLASAAPQWPLTTGGW